MRKHNLLGSESIADKLKKAQSELAQPAKRTKKQNQRKLFINGRLDRKNYPYLSRSLMLLPHIEEEIKTYCQGGDLPILLYLIREGLKAVKASEVPIIIDVEDIETELM